MVKMTVRNRESANRVAHKTHGLKSSAGTRCTSPSWPGDGSHSALSVDGNVGEGEEDIALLALAAEGGVGEASLHSSDSAGEDAPQSVGVEAGAKASLNLVLEHLGDLITAKVGHGNGVLAREAVTGQDRLHTSHKVIHSQSSREVRHHLTMPVCKETGMRCGRMAGYQLGCRLEEQHAALVAVVAIAINTNSLPCYL